MIFEDKHFISMPKKLQNPADRREWHHITLWVRHKCFSVTRSNCISIIKVEVSMPEPKSSINDAMQANVYIFY